MRFETTVLRLRDGCTVHPLPEGGGVLRNWTLGAYFPLNPDEYFVVAAADGKRTLAELNRMLFDHTGRLQVSLVADLAERLGKAGLRASGTGKEEPPHENPALRLLRTAAFLRFPIGNGTPRQGREEGILGFLGVVFLALVAGLIVMPAPGVREFTAAGSYFLGFAAFYGVLALGLSLRSLIVAAMLRAVGAGVWSWGVGLTFLVPHVWVDERDAAVAGRSGRVTVAAAALAVPLALQGSMAWAGAHHGVLRAAYDAFGLLALLAASPFLPSSDLRKLLAALAGVGDVGKRARGYLFGRLLRRSLTMQKTVAGERVFIFSAMAYPIWLYVALVAFGGILQDGAFALARDWMTTEDPLLAVSLAGVMAGIVLAAGLAVAVPVFWALQAVKNFVQKRFSGKAKVQAAAPEHWSELANVTLFAALDETQLRELAAVVEVVSFKPGDVIIRQGEQGDRFYSLRSGSVEVRVTDATGFESRVAVLKPGDSFGEVALLERVPRTATVRALEEGSCFALRDEVFQAFAAQHAAGGHSITSLLRITADLRSSKLFGALDARTLRSLAGKFRPWQVRPGQMVVREGDEGEDFFFIRSGSFNVLKNGQIVADLKPGESFGEVALLSKDKRNATVRSAEAGELLVLSRADFVAAATANLTFGLGVEKTYKERAAPAG